MPGLVQTVPPASEPVSLTDMKLHLRVDITDDDALISALITAARQHVEYVTSRQLLNATFLYTLDSFPPYDLSVWLIRQPRPYLPQTRQFQGSGGGTIRLPKAPVTAVTQIQYIEPIAGALITHDPSQWMFDITTEPCRLTPTYGNIWPITRWQVEAVQVTFTAGYGALASSVPPLAIAAIKMLVGHWYENRETSSPVRLMETPKALDTLLRDLWYGEYV